MSEAKDDKVFDYIGQRGRNMLRIFTNYFFATMILLCIIPANIVFASPPPCPFASDCLLTEGVLSSYTITQAAGGNYICNVVAHDGTLVFTLKGLGPYKMLEGYGGYAASPTLAISVKVEWADNNPATQGLLLFDVIVGGTGSVRCTPTADPI